MVKSNSSNSGLISFIMYPRTVLLSLECMKNYLKTLVKHRSWAPLSEILIWKVWGGDHCKLPGEADAAASVVSIGSLKLQRQFRTVFTGQSPEARHSAENQDVQILSQAVLPDKPTLTNLFPRSLAFLKR